MKLQVGNIVWIAPYYSSDRTSLFKTGFEAQVTRVGTKYVHVNYNKLKFDLHTGAEITSYSPNFRLWATRAEYDEDKARRDNWRALQLAVKSYVPPENLSSQDLAEILKLFNPQT